MKKNAFLFSLLFGVANAAYGPYDTQPYGMNPGNAPSGYPNNNMQGAYSASRDLNGYQGGQNTPGGGYQGHQAGRAPNNMQGGFSADRDFNSYQGRQNMPGGGYQGHQAGSAPNMQGGYSAGRDLNSYQGGQNMPGGEYQGYQAGRAPNMQGNIPGRYQENFLPNPLEQEDDIDNDYRTQGPQGFKRATSIYEPYSETNRWNEPPRNPYERRNIDQQNINTPRQHDFNRIQAPHMQERQQRVSGYNNQQLQSMFAGKQQPSAVQKFATKPPAQPSATKDWLNNPNQKPMPR